MLSSTSIRNVDENVGSFPTKTPAGKTPRRVAFGDISNRKQTPTAFKKSAAAPKSMRRVVEFQLTEKPQTLPKVKSTVADGDLDDDDDPFRLELPAGGFQKYSSIPSGVQLDEEDWSDIIGEEKELLAEERLFAKRRQELQDKETQEGVESFNQCLSDLWEQDARELKALATSTLSHDRSFEIDEDSEVFAGIDF